MFLICRNGQVSSFTSSNVSANTSHLVQIQKIYYFFYFLQFTYCGNKFWSDYISFNVRGVSTSQPSRAAALEIFRTRIPLLDKTATHRLRGHRQSQHVSICLLLPVFSCVDFGSVRQKLQCKEFKKHQTETPGFRAHRLFLFVSKNRNKVKGPSVGDLIKTQ